MVAAPPPAASAIGPNVSFVDEEIDNSNANGSADADRTADEQRFQSNLFSEKDVEAYVLATQKVEETRKAVAKNRDKIKNEICMHTTLMIRTAINRSKSLIDAVDSETNKYIASLEEHEEKLKKVIQKLNRGLDIDDMGRDMKINPEERTSNQYRAMMSSLVREVLDTGLDSLSTLPTSSVEYCERQPTLSVNYNTLRVLDEIALWGSLEWGQLQRPPSPVECTARDLEGFKDESHIAMKGDIEMGKSPRRRWSYLNLMTEMIRHSEKGAFGFPPVGIKRETMEDPSSSLEISQIDPRSAMASPHYSQPYLLPNPSHLTPITMSRQTFFHPQNAIAGPSPQQALGQMMQPRQFFPPSPLAMQSWNGQDRRSYYQPPPPVYDPRNILCRSSIIQHQQQQLQLQLQPVAVQENGGAPLVVPSGPLSPSPTLSRSSSIPVTQTVPMITEIHSPMDPASNEKQANSLIPDSSSRHSAIHDGVQPPPHNAAASSRGTKRRIVAAPSMQADAPHLLSSGFVHNRPTSMLVEEDRDAEDHAQTPVLNVKQEAADVSTHRTREKPPLGDTGYHHSVYEVDADGHERYCAVCRADGSVPLATSNLMCDNCPHIFHPSCHVPPVKGRIRDVPDNWKCINCQHAQPITNRKANIDANGVVIISQVLFACYEDHKNAIYIRDQKTFGPTVPRNAMCLNKVRDRIAATRDVVDGKRSLLCRRSKPYGDYYEFIEDMEKVFKSCSEHNPENSEPFEAGLRVWHYYQTTVSTLMPAFTNHVDAFRGKRKGALATKMEVVEEAAVVEEPQVPTLTTRRSGGRGRVSSAKKRKT